MSYKKVGGLHFIKVGRFGCSFYLTKPKPKPVTYRTDGGSNALLALMAVAIFFIA